MKHNQLQQVNSAQGSSVDNRRNNYAPIETESRTHVETACAAFHLTRKSQTLRTWACFENGPIRPIRINGRLAWSVSDIKRVLAGDII